MDVGVDLTYLGGIERGRRNPTVAVVGRIAAALGVHPRDLFDDPADDSAADSQGNAG